MLSDAQIDHFRTFGFLVLPGYLSEQETTALAAELDHAHRDPFGARYGDRPDNGGCPSTPRASSTSTRPASTTTPARASRRSSSSPTWSR